MLETWVPSLGSTDPLEEEMAAHPVLLPVGNPMDRGPWWASVHGVAKESDTTCCLVTKQQQQQHNLLEGQGQCPVAN